MAPLFSEGLPLFIGDPKPTSLRQQEINNCPLPALLAAMANVNPGRFRTMIQERTATTDSWFFGKPVTSAGTFKVKRIITVRFQHAAIDVSPILYYNNLMKPRFTMAEGNGGWASYVEKAYVAYRAQFHYANLDFNSKNPISVSRMMEDLVQDFTQLVIGEDSGEILRDLEPDAIDPEGVDRFTTTNGEDLNKKGLRSKLIDVLELASKRTTIATTPYDSSVHNKLGLVGMHTYAVLSYKKGVATLFDAMHAETLKVGVSDFLQGFDNVFQGRPKN